LHLPTMSGFNKSQSISYGVERTRLPLRPSSAGSPWRNPGRLRLRDVDRLQASGRHRPSSAPSQSQSSRSRVIHATEVPSAVDILSKAYAERVDEGLMQYHMKFGVKSPTDRHAEKQDEKADTIDLCSIPGHMEALPKDVYVAKCNELLVKANSGVLAWISQSNHCLCRREGCNLRNMLIGNRGILSVLPLIDCMKGLKSLSLVGNGLRDAGARSLLTTLRVEAHLPSLSVFDLSRNPLSTKSGEELEPVVGSRRRLLLLGLAATSIGGTQRERLLFQALDNFKSADPAEALEAWRLASSSSFADSELTACCATHVDKLNAVPDVSVERPVSAPPKRPPGSAPRARKAITSYTSHDSRCQCSICSIAAESKSRICAT
jgi:hypothetical protein